MFISEVKFILLNQVTAWCAEKVNKDDEWQSDSFVSEQWKNLIDFSPHASETNPYEWGGFNSLINKVLFVYYHPRFRLFIQHLTLFMYFTVSHIILILYQKSNWPSMIDNSINIAPSLKLPLPVRNGREWCNHKKWSPDTIPLQYKQQTYLTVLVQSCMSDHRLSLAIHTTMLSCF